MPYANVKAIALTVVIAALAVWNVFQFVYGYHLLDVVSDLTVENVALKDEVTWWRDHERDHERATYNPQLEQVDWPYAGRFGGGVLP